MLAIRSSLASLTAALGAVVAFLLVHLCAAVVVAGTAFYGVAQRGLMRTAGPIAPGTIAR